MVPGIGDSRVFPAFIFPAFIMQQLPRPAGGSPGVHVPPGRAARRAHSALIHWPITDSR